MKTLVILQNVQFFIIVIQGHTGSLQQPGYICEARDLKSAIFNNPSAMITTLYQQVFKSNTRFSGSLIMGHNKMEIREQLLKNINFHPFCCFLGKFWLFVYIRKFFQKIYIDNYHFIDKYRIYKSMVNIM
ncbi:hypothetical protein RclHR1_17810007 [Rhizophagus clarus]|uniref:Uncharacterized protein n=1 Tax=Rhizophagus clarus TaxID=94130 RepID=A0A2Z6QKT5_9GLOM|nr:hypothetical protein RclHR1_17810007 [Rhizophagus clarus]GES81957.1 hypothetical protein GLOIN_2v1777152 [Rhizophagus clarus]